MIRKARAMAASRWRAAAVVWRNADLRNLEVAWLAFNVAEYAFVVGLGVYAYRQGGAVAVGVVTLIRTAPALVSGPLAAVFTDRLRRERVLRTGLVARLAATLGIVALLGAAGPAPAVYALAAMDAVAASLFWPAHSALIPELARSPEQLTAGNAVGTAMESLGTLVGPGFAALGLLIWDPVAVFVLGAAAFMSAIVATAGIATDRVVTSTSARPLTELLDGLTYTIRHRDVRLVVGLWTLESFVLGMTEVFVVVIAVDSGLGEPGVGLLSGVAGFGGLVGAIVLSAVRREHPYGRALMFSLFGFGLSLLLLPVAGIGAVLALVVFAAAGLAEGYVDISAQTLLQRLVPEAHLARVLGGFEGAYWGSLGLGAVAASALTVTVGLSGALVVTGVVLVGATTLARQGLLRVDRGLELPPEELALFEAVPGLSALPVTTLEHLARTSSAETVEPGITIVKQGDVGDRFYVVEHGRVVVRVDGAEVAEIGPGGYFGEIALLANQSRMADVVAVDDVALRSIDGDVFVAAVTGHLRSEAAMSTVMVARLAESSRYRRYS